LKPWGLPRAVSHRIRKGEDRGMNVILSGGGLDTLCCCHWAKTMFSENTLLHFSYGQEAEFNEKWATRKLRDYFGFYLTEVELKPLPFMKDVNSIDGSEVPARNLIFLSHAISVCKEKNYSHLTLGIDNSCYPDSTSLFGSLTQDICLLFGISLHLPMLSINKKSYIADNKLPVEITWSCYRGSDIPCYNCLGCEKRSFLR